MIICISGSVGTGKTTIAKSLAQKLKFKCVDINMLIKKNKIYSGYNKKLETYEVDVKKLNKFLVLYIKGKDNLILDSHLSHYLNKKFIDYCIICKCDLKELKKRLEKRKYSKEKIRENLDAEIFDICRTEAEQKGHRIKVIDTTKGFKNLE